MADITNPELVGLERQRAMAQALVKQGFQTPEAQMVSGRYVPVNPFEYLGNLAQIYQGNKLAEEADVKQQALIEMLRNKENANLQQGLNQLYGTPEFVQQGPTPTGGNIPVQPATKPDRRLALATLLAPEGGAASKAIASKLAEQEFVVEKTPEKIALYKFAQTPEGGNYKGSFNDFENQMTPYQKAHLGVIAANQAQSRVPMGYRMKKDGTLEAIPGGPADQKAQIVDTGRQTVDTLVTGLKDKYDLLKSTGGITSTSEGPISNAMAATSSSGFGQYLGKTFGTANQSERNKIAQSRPLLLQAIAKATGMSSKQMDSNAELQMYLKAATDPSLDYEANIYALDQLQALYGIGGKAPVVGNSGNTLPSDSDIDAEIARRKKGKK